jgi:hypothetical protein
MKFRKKLVVVEATQFTGDNGDAIAAFMGCQHPFIENGGLMIGTLEGVHRANPGDWIIKGVKGEFYPCKPDIFAATYESVQEKERTNMAKETTEKTLEEMTFDELVELATLRIHSDLLEGGGKEMKRAIRLWMRQAILWSKGQK